VEQVGAALFVTFGDDEEDSAGFEDAEDFPHVVRQVGPVVLRFDSGDQVKSIFSEGRTLGGSFLDQDTAGGDALPTA
jgi:hypothetical protein